MLSLYVRKEQIYIRVFEFSSDYHLTLMMTSQRLSKRQSQTTAHLRTPITQMIFFNQDMLFLGSNHFLIQVRIIAKSSCLENSLDTILTN